MNMTCGNVLRYRGPGRDHGSFADRHAGEDDRVSPYAGAVFNFGDNGLSDDERANVEPAFLAGSRPEVVAQGNMRANEHVVPDFHAWVYKSPMADDAAVADDGPVYNRACGYAAFQPYAGLPDDAGELPDLCSCSYRGFLDMGEVVDASGGVNHRCRADGREGMG